MNNNLRGFIRLEKRENSELIRLTVFTQLKNKYEKKYSMLVFTKNLLQDIIEKDIQNFVDIKHCNNNITAMHFYFLENTYNAKNHNIAGKFFYAEIKTSDLAAFIASNKKTSFLKCITKPRVKLELDYKLLAIQKIELHSNKLRKLVKLINTWITNSPTLTKIKLYNDWDILGFTKEYYSGSNMVGGLIWNENRNLQKENWSSHT